MLVYDEEIHIDQEYEFLEWYQDSCNPFRLSDTADSLKYPVACWPDLWLDPKFITICVIYTVLYS